MKLVAAGLLIYLALCATAVLVLGAVRCASSRPSKEARP